MTISLCMIVKNEEDVLQRCLESIKESVDEIIIVDTGSTDATKDIAKKYTDKVYDFDWIEDFSAARNFSFEKASMDYCMWLDADDILSEHNSNQFKELKENMQNVDVVMMKYSIQFDNSGNPVYSYYRERILKNNGLYKWSGRVHEVIETFGNIVHSEIEIYHKKQKTGNDNRNLRIYEKQIEEKEDFSPRDMFYYGRELYYHERYSEASEMFEKFLEKDGWLENNIEACQFLSYCYNNLKNEKLALNSLLRSFIYDSPRAEICCELGAFFFDRNLKQAIFWYETALTIPCNDKSGAFIITDYYGFLPCIQLCVLYDRMGDRDRAVFYNEQAGKMKPESEAVAYNKEYFSRNTNEY